MNGPENIRKLLEDFYKGLTTLEQEEEIRIFFRSGKVPEKLEEEARLFSLYELEKNASGRKDLEEKILQRIEARPGRTVNLFSQGRSYWIGSAAAVILVLLAVFIDTQILKQDPYIVKQDTFEDPYQAYAEATRVMSYVSEKLNTGTEPLKNLEKLDNGTNYIQPVFSFAPGIQKLEYLNTIDRAKNLISK